MNIFVLSHDVNQAAKWHVDRHVVKMPLESAQMLCTNLTQLKIENPYLPVHAKHPCTIWAGQSRSNFKWLCDLGIELCKEYTFRYKKVHKCEEVINYCMRFIDVFPNCGMTPFAQAMPDEFKNDNPVKAYRDYYVKAKNHLHKWTLRSVPEWCNSTERNNNVQD
jgi:hypothetical protein